MRTVDSDEGPIYVVQTRDDACRLWDWLTPYRLQGAWLGWDGETNAHDPWDPGFRLRTAQISDGQVGWVIQAERPGMLDVVREVTRAHPRWVAHFAENDMRFAERGAPDSVRLDSVEPHFYDTQPVLAWYDPRTVTSQKDGIDPGIWLPRALKPTANRLLGTDTLTQAEQALTGRFRELAPVGHRTTKACKQWGFEHIDADDEVYLRYAGLDSMLELRMWRLMAAELHRRGQWDACLADLRLQWHIDLMTFRGMPVDPAWARRLDAHFARVVDLNAPLLAAHGIGPSGMGPAVGTAFSALGVVSDRETKSGNDSWDRVMIESIREGRHTQQDPPIYRQAEPKLLMSQWELACARAGQGRYPGREHYTELIAELAESVTTVRQATKFRSAYVGPMLDAEDRDGRIHCSMRAIGTGTHRMSAERPAIQQMPKRSSKIIRAAFTSGHPGWVIVSADLKQGEPRVMAALSGDRNLQADIEAGDINAALASLTYGDRFVAADGKDPAKPSYDLRQRGKAGFLAKCYGGGLKKLASSALLNVAMSLVTEIVNRWDTRYARLKAFGDQTNLQRAVVLDNGWVAPLWDRWCSTHKGVALRPDCRPSRLGLNVATQGNQAILLGNAIQRLIDWGWSWSFMMFVHDEIVCCVPATMADQCVAALTAAMTTEFHGFPIRCDAGIEGHTWMPQVDFDGSDSAAVLQEVV